MKIVFYVVALLALILIAVPIYNRYFRPQVYLVNVEVGSDTTAAGGPNQTPSNLANILAVAQQYNATVATGDQVGLAAGAGAQWNQWGWMVVGNGAYVAGFPVPQGGVISTDMATALGCNQSALSVNPCLSSVVPNGVSTCGASPSNLTYAYDSSTASVTAGSQSMSCFNANVIFDNERLLPLNPNTPQYYVYNPSYGVLLYGVKPGEGTDPNVVPFNSGQYSQFGIL
jgi:hypothetical protein